MITHNAICDRCGNQTEVTSVSSCFQIVLKVYTLSAHPWNDTFGNNWGTSKKSTSSSEDKVDWINSTFCDKECFVEYLKEKMLDNGLIQQTEKEMEEMEKGFPEVKELKRVAKALKELENMASGPIGEYKK